MFRNYRPAQWLIAAALGGALAVAAGCGSSGSGGTGGGTGTTTGSATTGSTGSGGENPPGVPASGIITAGGTATSAKFSLTFAVGQSTQNIGKSSSATHTVQGGVVSANGDTSK